MSGESRHRGRSSDVEESGRCKSSTKIRSSSRDSSRRRDKHRQSSSDEDDDRNGHRRSDRNYDRNRHISPHRDERRRRHDSTNRDGADKRDKGKGGERDERYRKEKRGSDDAENSGRRHKDKPSYADDDRGRRGSKKSGRSEKDTSLRDNEVARGGSRRRSISEDNRPGEQRDLGENNREKNGRKSGGSESDKDGRHRDSEALTIHDEKDRETQENDKSRGGENVVQRRVGRTAAEKPQTDSYGRQINYNREAHEREKEKLDADKAKFDKAQRRLEKENKRKQKMAMKITETAEEKRARRLAKKEMKEQGRRRNMGWDDEHAGYTNTDNPFGDSRLLEKFTWGKKMEKDSQMKGLTAEEIMASDARRLEENKHELAKVKERRIQREKDIEDREKLRELEAREAMSSELDHYAEKEEEFYVEQAKMRSMIRIESGRPKPIDLLVKYITVDIDSDEATIAEPYLVFQGLSLKDLDDLDADIEVYLGIGNDIDFWRDMLVLCKYEMDTLAQKQKGSNINDSVRQEIMKVMSGKSLRELKQLETQIAQKLSQGGVVDVAFWESLREHLDVYKAKARLAEMHATVLAKKLDRLQSMGQDGAELIASNAPEEAPPAENDEDLLGDEEAEDEEEPGVVYGPEVEGIYSLPVTDDEQDAIDPETEEEAWEKERHKQMAIRLGIRLEEEAVAGEVPSGDAQKAPETDEFMKTSTHVEEGDLIFNAEMPISGETYDWSDKYRPRKPRFFSRVHTGFEWNKYNQTHYDSRENPPPKIVQGYKFNVFYPDLLDRSKAPTYKLIPIPDEPDFCIIRFSAGPPYEDIAFKVVKREWEYSHKRGFKCQFDRGIFQVWFHFRRNRYRK